MNKKSSIVNLFRAEIHKRQFRDIQKLYEAAGITNQMLIEQLHSHNSYSSVSLRDSIFMDIAYILADTIIEEPEIKSLFIEIYGKRFPNSIELVKKVEEELFLDERKATLTFAKGIMILIAAACLASVTVYILTRKGIIRGVTGTSLAGAVAHNTGQVLMASLVLRTPALLISYLPFLVGIGAAVGLLTGVVTERVLKALHYQGIVQPKETPHEDQ